MRRLAKSNGISRYLGLPVPPLIMKESLRRRLSQATPCTSSAATRCSTHSPMVTMVSQTCRLAPPRRTIKANSITRRHHQRLLAYYAGSLVIHLHFTLAPNELLSLSWSQSQVVSNDSSPQ